MNPPRLVVNAARRVFGPRSGVARRYREWNRRRIDRIDHGDVRIERGKNFVVLRSRQGHGPRRGIYLFGGCDLPSLYKMESQLASDLAGPLAIYQQEGGLGTTRSDRQLQLLEGPRSDDQELIERLRLPKDYFTASLFEPTFELQRRGPQSFPKNVVVLSSAAEIIRSLYRRRSTGTLVDPGGWWLNQSVDSALKDQETVRWFRDEFEPVGRLSVEEFEAGYDRYLKEIRTRVQPEVILVFNVLSVEPADRTHNYQFRPKAEGLRRRNFVRAIEELPRRHDDVLVCDVDRTLKLVGVSEQLDFAHFPEETYQPLADEAFRVLSLAGVV